MSAENKAQAYEYRIQDLQSVLKTVRKAEAQARQAEADAVAGLEALRKESNGEQRLVVLQSSRRTAHSTSVQYERTVRHTV